MFGAHAATVVDTSISAIQYREGLAHVKTQKERSEERRQEKLAAMQDQIEQGTLKVRKMTPEERAALPPRPSNPKRRPR